MKRASCLTAVFLCLLMMSGCSKADSGDMTVTIGYFPNITHAQALVMKEQGNLDMAANGAFTTRWMDFNSGSAESLSLIAGDVDIGFIGPGPAIMTYLKSNKEFVVLCGVSDYGAALIAGKEAVITGVADLANYTVAVPGIGNTQHICLLKLLEEVNLASTEEGGNVHVVAAENADILMLLNNGDVDAAFVPEPWVTQMEEQIGARVVADYDEVWKEGNYPSAMVITSKTFIREHPDVVDVFLKQLKEVTEQIDNDEESAAVMVSDSIYQITGQQYDVGQLMKSFARMELTTEQVSYEAMEIFARIAAEQELIEGQIDESILWQGD